MRLLTLVVADYGPIQKELSIKFHPKYTAIVSRNGGGKTWLLELIAGLAGKPLAFEIIRERTCGYCFISVETNDGPKNLYLSGRIGDHESEIRQFQQQLTHQVSFGVTEPCYSFDILNNLAVERDNFATDGILPLRRFLQELDMTLDYIETDEGVFVHTASDGVQQAVRLYNSLIHKDIPVLWDYPENSLHIMVGRKIPELITTFQVIITTHGPEYIRMNDRDGSAFSID